MSDFKNIDRYIAELSRRGVCFDIPRLCTVLGEDKYTKLWTEHGVEHDGHLELHPVITRTVSGRIQTSSPNINGFSKEARNCVYSDKPIYSVDVVSEELNIIMESIGKDFGGDVYGEIARHIRPVVRAVVLEDTTGGGYAPLKVDEVLYGKEAAGRLDILFSRLFDASFLTLDGSSFDGRGSHENFSIVSGGKKYTIKSMQRLVAGSEKALFEKKEGALMLLTDCETGEPCLMAREVEWELDNEKKIDAPTGVSVGYYHGTIKLLEGEELFVEDEVFASMREDVKRTLIAYCYGASREQAWESCEILNPLVLLKLYDSLGIRAGLKDFVAKHRDGNLLKIDGRVVDTHYEAGTPYTKYASVLIQNIGVAILDELLGIAYSSGVDVLYTEHDELLIGSELTKEELEERFVSNEKSKHKWCVTVRTIKE